MDKARFDKEYSLRYTENPSREEENILQDGLVEEAFKAKGLGKMTPFGFFVKDKKGTVVGGATGFSYYGCLYTDLLWIHADLRNHGWGSKILKEIETLAKKRGCRFLHVTTMDWEALDFYKKYGYTVEHIVKGYDKDSFMYILRKSAL